MSEGWGAHWSPEETLHIFGIEETAQQVLHEVRKRGRENERQANREADRQTGREEDRQTDRQGGRQTDRQTGR